MCSLCRFKQVFYKERLSGYYGVGVFILSNFLSSFPFLVAVSTITGTIVFYMVKFRPEFSHYIFFCLNIFGCIAMVESVMMIVAALVPNFLMGIIAGAGVLVSDQPSTSKASKFLNGVRKFHFNPVFVRRGS